MTTLLLSAGNATRLGDYAPKGCKAALVVGDRTMIDWTWENVGAPTVVCRPEHTSAFSGAVPHILCDEGGGPAVALRRALSKLPASDEPITIVYADTWVPEWAVPNLPEFVGVAAGAGGRSWDVLCEDGNIAYLPVREGDVAIVCIGLYRFADPENLLAAVNLAIEKNGGGETGMGDVINAYGLMPFAPIVGWQDVGDPLALARWRPM